MITVSCPPVKKASWKDVRDFGAKGDDSTDDTVAIEAANATGKKIYFPEGIYLDDGGHRLSNTGQIWYGDGRGRSIIKKRQGTNYILDTTHAVNFVGLKDLTFDGNNLGGSQVIWRGHYSVVKNIDFKNQGGTSYPLFLSGVNLSHFENLMFWDGCYGGILSNQSADVYVPQPIYGCLYSTFDNIRISRTNGGSALRLAGARSQVLAFNNLYFEDTQAAVPALEIGGAGASNCSNIVFNNIWGEPALLTASLVRVGGCYNIHFVGGKISTSVAQTELWFDLEAVDGVSVEKILFYDNFSIADQDKIEIHAVKSGRFIGNTCSFLNNFNFITGIAGNLYITVKNNVHRDYGAHPGRGTNLWTGTEGLTIENDEMTQNYDTAAKVSVLDNLERGAVGTMIGDETFGPADGRIFIKDPGGAARNFNPSGTFRAFQKVTLVNTADAAETIAFDSAGINQAVARNERGIFVYNGLAWLKIYVGS